MGNFKNQNKIGDVSLTGKAIMLSSEKIMDLFDKCVNYQEPQMLKSIDLYPFFRVVEGSEGTSVVADGREVVMIGSNNYLGLTHDPRVKEAAINAINKYGTGCTGSRFLNGRFSCSGENPNVWWHIKRRLMGS